MLAADCRVNAAHLNGPDFIIAPSGFSLQRNHRWRREELLSVSSVVRNDECIRERSEQSSNSSESRVDLVPLHHYVCYLFPVIRVG